MGLNLSPEKSSGRASERVVGHFPEAFQQELLWAIRPLHSVYSHLFTTDIYMTCACEIDKAGLSPVNW